MTFFMFGAVLQVNEGHREVHRPFTSELPVNEGEAPKPVDTADKETVPSSTGGSGQEEQISELDSQLGVSVLGFP